MRSRWLYRASLMLLVLSSCSSKSKDNHGTEKTNGAPKSLTAPVIVPPPSNAETKSQWYRIEINADDGLVPFLLEVQQPLQPKSTAVVRNGDERIPREMICEGMKCELSFPVFASALLLNFESEESVVGSWKFSDYYPMDLVPLSGIAIESEDSKHRYVEEAAPSVDVSGKWVLSIKGVGPGKAEFVQNENGTVSGWLIPTNIGDVRYLVGRVDGKRLRLSTFDGQHAYNFELTVSSDSKKLEGMWHNHSIWHYPLDGWRGKEPSLADLHTLRMKPGKTKMELPELEPLQGKPVIVDLYGTWCPACIDLMPTLVDLNKRYKGEGLEILSVAFEPSDDPELVKQLVTLFEERYGITWHSAIRDVDELTDAIYNLDNATGFPITIFIDRDGVVQGLHSGFVSPAAADAHAALLAKFDELTKKILASKAKSAP